MKLQHTIFIILILSTLSSIAQVDTVVTYFDKNWKKTAIKADALYYRKAWKDSNKTHVSDYFMSNGKAQMTGSYIGEGDSIKDGHFVYFYENGWKEKEGDFRNNLPIGNWKHYYKSGKLSSNQNYMTDVAEIEKLIHKAEEIKDLNFYGHYNGVTEWHHDNGQLSSKEHFENGKLIAVAMYNSNGKSLEVPTDSLGNYLLSVTSTPKIDISQFIQKNLKYPKKARNLNQEGKVKVEFTVEKDESVQEVFVTKSSGFPLLDEAAVEIVRQFSGKFYPGMRHGIYIRTKFTQNITFKLDNGKKKK